MMLRTTSGRTALFCRFVVLPLLVSTGTLVGCSSSLEASRITFQGIGLVPEKGRLIIVQDVTAALPIDVDPALSALLLPLEGMGCPSGCLTQADGCCERQSCKQCSLWISRPGSQPEPITCEELLAEPVPYAYTCCCDDATQ